MSHRHAPEANQSRKSILESAWFSSGLSQKMKLCLTRSEIVEGGLKEKGTLLLFVLVNDWHLAAFELAELRLRALST